jgi:hypothetical protein
MCKKQTSYLHTLPRSSRFLHGHDCTRADFAHVQEAAHLHGLHIDYFSLGRCQLARTKLIRSSNMVLLRISIIQEHGCEHSRPSLSSRKTAFLQCVLHIILAFGKVGGNVRG